MDEESAKLRRVANFVGTIPTTKAEGHRFIYTNSSRMGIGPYDIRLMFGQVVENATGVSVSEEIVTIIMSPEHAKSTLKNLATTVAAYEEAFGEIKDVQAALEKAKAASETSTSEAKPE